MNFTLQNIGLKRIASALTFAFVLVPLAQAQTPAPPPAQIASASIPNAKLLGQGYLRWFGLKIYEAKLFGSTELNGSLDWQKVPLTLDLTYARSIKGEQIAQTSGDEIERLDSGDKARLSTWRDAMKKTFPDVKAGDRLTGIYKPNQPMTLLFNGKVLPTIGDEAFARAFFAIWLDDDTKDKNLRAALLGDSKLGSVKKPAAGNAAPARATN